MASTFANFDAERSSTSTRDTRRTVGSASVSISKYLLVDTGRSRQQFSRSRFTFPTIASCLTPTRSRSSPGGSYDHLYGMDVRPCAVPATGRCRHRIRRVDRCVALQEATEAGSDEVTRAGRLAFRSE